MTITERRIRLRGELIAARHYAQRARLRGDIGLYEYYSSLVVALSDCLRSRV